MNYRILGRTGLKVSEIGLGGEWFNGLSQAESTAIVDAAEENGINYIDIFMPQAPTRDHLGAALKGRRDKFIIQGHLCTIYEDGQYTRIRDIEKTKRSFQDLLDRLQTDYIDVGMIHYVDSEEDFQKVFHGPVLQYAQELKEKGVIRHIGMSSHNPHIALKAVESGVVDVLMFSINPAYDMEAADTDIYDLMEFKGMEKSGLVVDEARQKLYSACETAGVAITVMKPLGAGTLLKAESSPFGVAMTVPQCIQYCLDRNGVKVVIVGCHTPPGSSGSGKASAAFRRGAELRPYLCSRRLYFRHRKVHVLQPLPALPGPSGYSRCDQVFGFGYPAANGAGYRDAALLGAARHRRGLSAVRPL